MKKKALLVLTAVAIVVGQACGTGGSKKEVSDSSSINEGKYTPQGDNNASKDTALTKDTAMMKDTSAAKPPKK
ncbi:hypothetical protein [Chitinophaga sp. 212800010-3]|uniref:hypothetical protein n=1 Tax=unclassified Chitinophaga TaxID=2619133 RepID=UPI002DED3044|nr:hypothetical protein [Chitinophaga sp. 212800010-3]